jgi:hypothetical protein
MIRSLRTLSLVLAMVFALCAVTASTASAGTALVTGGPTVTGVDNKGEGINTELTGVIAMLCLEATYSGTAVESTITLTPTFHNCFSGGVLPTTITVNDCAYRLTLGTLAGDSATVQTLALECEQGKQVEAHVYTDTKFQESLCTFNFVPQSPTPGLSVTDKTNGTLRVQGEITNIISTVSGACLTFPRLNWPNHNTIPSPVASALHIDITLSAEGALGLETQEEENPHQG